MTSNARESEHSTPALCLAAIQLLDDAMQKPPTELKAEVDVAERKIAQLRDRLIEALRAGSDPNTRATLDKVNVALTLVVGLEYPMGGLQRNMLDRARTTLREALDAGPLE